MASNVSKEGNGHIYYYLRQMHRVNGKPKMAWERYLGKASDIKAPMDGAVAVPARTRCLIRSGAQCKPDAKFTMSFSSTPRSSTINYQ